LRDVVATHGLAPKKALGQNFLFDLNLTGKIARAAGPLEGFTVFEIGPGPGWAHAGPAGPGRLARRRHGARSRAACRCLAEIAAHYPGRLEVVEGDALETSIWQHWPMVLRPRSLPTCPTMSARNC
jgi:16S rRNA (adenine1518-N6/adenine1519-N6)-dimethyltransferase